MIPIPDDPIIACMERTGYPPWMLPECPENDEDPEDDKVQERNHL